MRRVLLVLAAALVMAAMLVASAMPVFADLPTDPNATCTGEDTSSYVANHNANGSDGGNQHLGGAFGPGQSETAQDPNFDYGQFRSDVSSSDCGNR